MQGLVNSFRMIGGFAADSNAAYVNVTYSSMGTGIFRASWSSKTWVKVCDNSWSNLTPSGLSGLAIDAQNLYFMVYLGSFPSYNTLQTVKWTACSLPTTPYSYQTLGGAFSNQNTDPLNVDGGWVYLRPNYGAMLTAYPVDPTGASRTIFLQTLPFTNEKVESISVRAGFTWAVTASYLAKFDMNGNLISAADLRSISTPVGGFVQRVFGLDSTKLAVQVYYLAGGLTIDRLYLIDITNF